MLASFEWTRLVVHALREFLAWHLVLRHLLCLDLLRICSRLLFWHHYRNFLLQSCMMHRYVWLWKSCIGWNDVWWEWMLACRCAISFLFYQVGANLLSGKIKHVTNKTLHITHHYYVNHNSGLFSVSKIHQSNTF
jgi:hypothetical protein